MLVRETAKRVGRRPPQKLGSTMPVDRICSNILSLGTRPMSQPWPDVNVASTSIPKDRWSARIALVEHHIRLEHDLEGVLHTFGDVAQYDDEARGEHYKGRNGVRALYEQPMRALPDLEIEVQRQHVTDDAVLVEVMIRGTHLGRWRGLPATNRVPSLRCVHLRRRRPSSRGKNLL